MEAAEYGDEDSAAREQHQTCGDPAPGRPVALDRGLGHGFGRADTGDPAAGDPGGCPGSEEGDGDGGEGREDARGAFQVRGDRPHVDESAVQPGGERQSGQRAQYTGHRSDDQRLTAEETAYLARCGGDGAQQCQFSVALLDGERKGAYDHEDRDEE